MEKIRGFEVVKEDMKRTDGVPTLPTRGSNKSAGYDFYANAKYTAKHGEIIKVWTDVKTYMQDDEVLIIDVRSSMGGKWMLANTLGIIDSDYHNNPSNDGNIGIFLKNISNEQLTIEKGDRIAQGIFIKYLTVDNDSTNSIRDGGFGSSGK